MSSDPKPNNPYTIIAFNETDGIAIAEHVWATDPQSAAELYAQMNRDQDLVVVAVLAGELQALYPEGLLAEHVSDIAQMADENEAEDNQ
ncbi:MAG: hypothetical protein AMXMBFR7_26360 [Planctomycetota bacterium]